MRLHWMVQWAEGARAEHCAQLAGCPTTGWPLASQPVIYLCPLVDAGRRILMIFYGILMIFDFMMISWVKWVVYSEVKMSFILQLILPIVANIFTLSLTFDIQKFEGRHYYFDNSRKLTWSEGASMCMERGLQMVNANTKSVNDFLKKATPKDRVYWLGLTSFFRWKSHIVGKLQDEIGWYSPTSELIFTDWCEKEPSKHIAAYRICNDNNQQLANAEIEDLATALINETNNRKASYWIGLKNFDIYGIPIKKWHWNSTRTAVTYQNWCAPQTHKLNPQYKNEWCGYIHKDEQCWKTEACDRDSRNVNGFICESSIIEPIATTTTTTPMPTTTITPTTTPTTTTTTPTPTTTTLASTTTTIHGVVYNPSKNHEVTFNDNYDIVKYKNHEYLMYFKDHKPRSWYQARDMCRTVWIGLQSYIQTVSGNKYLYWKWTGPENDIRLKNWCLHTKFQKATMCGYVLHNTLCWMAEKCTFNDVTSFVCEDKQASTQNPAHAFQHYLAISYHKPITATATATTTATTTTTTPKPTTTTTPMPTITTTSTTTTTTPTTTTTTTPTTTTNTPTTTTTTTPTTTTTTPTTTTTTPTPTTTTTTILASTTTTIHGVLHNPSRNHEVTFNGISYHFYDNTVSQAQANKICQRNGYSLVTIDDTHINVFLQTEIVENKRITIRICSIHSCLFISCHVPFRKPSIYIDTQSKLIFSLILANYWIGLEAHSMKQTPNDLIYWMWINTRLNMKYKNWCSDQIISKDLVCAYVKAGKKDVCWMFSDCGKSNAVSGFICENKIKHTNNYDIVKYKNHEYLMYYKEHKPKSWYQARDMCRRKNKNLLTLDSNEKIDFFNEIFFAKNMS
uniref:C-type lectin domain-containing protein n=1 Tax=Strigamia maritima TaxID=126957 RepID=T1JGV9_STRMM